MRLLLDTHVLLWALRSPNRLSATALALIRDPANVLLISSISAYEVADKFRLGKLPDAAPILFAYADYLGRLQATELPITSRHGLTAGQLPWEHRDPFDRILAAQSITDSVPLVTSDTVFATVAGVHTIWD